MMSLVFSFWMIVVSLAAVEWFLLLGDAAHRGPSGKGFSHNPLMSILCQIWDVPDAEEGRLQAIIIITNAHN